MDILGLILIVTMFKYILGLIITAMLLSQVIVISAAKDSPALTASLKTHFNDPNRVWNIKKPVKK
jgi:hypothetical protein